jgi:hypothetical protein
MTQVIIGNNSQSQSVLYIWCSTIILGLAIALPGSSYVAFQSDDCTTRDPSRSTCNRLLSRNAVAVLDLYRQERMAAMSVDMSLSVRKTTRVEDVKIPGNASENSEWLVEVSRVRVSLGLHFPLISSCPYSSKQNRHSSQYFHICSSLRRGTVKNL